MSHETYRRLVENGAPELPEGFVYRVGFREGFVPCVTAQVRERVPTKRRPDRTKAITRVEELPAYFYGLNHPTHPGANVTDHFARTADVCRVAFDTYEAAIRDRALRRGYNAVLGDHP